MMIFQKPKLGYITQRPIIKINENNFGQLGVLFISHYFHQILRRSLPPLVELEWPIHNVGKMKITTEK